MIYAQVADGRRTVPIALPYTHLQNAIVKRALQLYPKVCLITKMQKSIWPQTNWMKILKLTLALACFAFLLAPFAARGQQRGKQSGSKKAPAEPVTITPPPVKKRSEEHTSELQSQSN